MPCARHGPLHREEGSGPASVILRVRTVQIHVRSQQVSFYIWLTPESVGKSTVMVAAKKLIIWMGSIRALIPSYLRLALTIGPNSIVTHYFGRCDEVVTYLLVSTIDFDLKMFQAWYAPMPSPYWATPYQLQWVLVCLAIKMAR